MSLLPLFSSFIKLQSSQQLSAGALRRLQEKKLRLLTEHACRTVPYYRQLFDQAGIEPGSIRTLADLGRIPLSTKSDLQAAGSDAITSSAFPKASLKEETTSGSSGRPLTIRFDTHWLALRRALFFRALLATGYRPGRRMLLISSGDRETPPRWLRWRYIPYKLSPQEMLHELNHFKPWLLYGWVTPLRQLAVYLRDNGGLAHRPGAIVTTAETLDGNTRQFLSTVFGAEVFEIYGLTEMGAVAWECQRHNGYHIAEETVIVEFLPSPQADGAYRLVMTNLELYATPFIRYDCGDLGQPAPAEDCDCGRNSLGLKRIEGRTIDCVRSPDGRVISPYQLTTAMEQVAGIERYQIIQDDFNRFRVLYEKRDSRSDDPSTAAAIQRVFACVLGPNIGVRTERRPTLDPPARRKFRVVECRVTE